MANGIERRFARLFHSQKGKTTLESARRDARDKHAVQMARPIERRPMNLRSISKIAFTVASALLLALFISSSKAQQSPSKGPATFDFTLAKPESVGFSPDRLEHFHALMQSVIDQKQIPGAVTILARHGKVIDYRTYGVRSWTTDAPMTKDSIFRDYSMTKPVTAVAIMILYEQGKWLPMDPIAKFIPEFSQLKVFKGMDAAGNMILETPNHAPTMQELMTHTAGFTYGFFGNTPVDQQYMKDGVMQSSSLQDMVGKLAKIPLLYQPGTRWSYSVSMDIQGYIIEKLSGKSLPEFYQEHIFKPLGMKDAAFFVSADKSDRFVTLYRLDDKGQLIADDNFRRSYSTQPTMPSGGGGMVSTAEDYFRFAQMLANGGELNGVRIISPASVALMSSNHLAPHLLTGEFGIGPHTMRAGFGYGYNCAVVFDPPSANLPEGRGTFFWDGAAGTWFWIDPTNDVVFVGMIQRILAPQSPNLEYQSRSAVYGALVNLKNSCGK
jgi:CubicO group peptidase (beta-lactamase class C family)